MSPASRMEELKASHPELADAIHSARWWLAEYRVRLEGFRYWASGYGWRYSHLPNDTNPFRHTNEAKEKFLAANERKREIVKRLESEMQRAA